MANTKNHGPGALALVLGLVSSACAGSDVGKCATDADCEAGASCQDELCVEAPGGEAACASAADCAAGERCVAAACVEAPAPSVSLVADRTSARLGVEVALDASASSVLGGGALSFAFAVTPADAGTVTAAPGAGAATLLLTKPHTDATASVTVTGPTGRSATATVSIASENSPPTVELTGPASTVQPGEAGAFQAAATDADGDVATYLWAVTPEGALLESDGAVATVTPDPATATDATFDVSVTADDGHGGTVSAGTTLQAHNLPPVLDLPIPAQVEHHCGATACTAAAPLAATATDAQPVTYSWRLVSGVAGVGAAFAPPDGVSPTVTLTRATVGPIAGSYQLEVTATDSLGGSAARQVELIVGNRPPQLHAHDGTELQHGYDAPGAVYFVDRPAGGFLTFVDPDGDPADPATVQWSGTPGVTFSDPRILDPDLHVEQAVATELLAVSVTLAAADNQGASAADTRAVPVGNRPPSILAFRGELSAGHRWLAGTPDTMTKAVGPSTFDATDADGDPLSHVVVVDPADLNAAAAGLTAGVRDGGQVLVAQLGGIDQGFDVSIRVEDAFGAFATSASGIVRFSNRSPVVSVAPGDRTFLAQSCSTVSCCVGPAGGAPCASVDVATRDGNDASIVGAMHAVSSASFQDPDEDPLPEARWALAGSSLTTPQIGLPPGSPPTALPATGGCVFGGALGSNGWDCTAELTLYTPVLIGPSLCTETRGSSLGASATIQLSATDLFGAFASVETTLTVTDDPADATCP